MKSPAAPHAPPDLTDFLERGPVALFLDFDGTLVPIAEGPDAISVPQNLVAQLQALADRLEQRVAIITGRSIDNLTQFLGPSPFHIAGSHGGHVTAPDGAVLREAGPVPEDVHRALQSFATEHQLLFERKAHGAALHYRARPELARKAEAFAKDLAGRRALAIKAGKCVVEIVQPGVNKGAAVELLRRQRAFAGAMPIFIGDDVTDEDGFAACTEHGGAGILVGQRECTTAQYRLNDVRDVHRWLTL